MSNSVPDRLSPAARALLARRAGIQPAAGPRRGAGGESAPLASPQLGQWVASEVALAGAAGSLPKTLHLEGPLDRGALRRALTEIARRHQVLRTVFSLQHGEPVQQVTPARAVELREVDLRSVPAAERPDAARALLDQEARRPFELSRDLLMRPVLAQLDDDRFELQVTFQHVAFDGWSNGIYLRELGALYSAYAAGQESPLAELPLQYADFAVWERSREATPAFPADRDYWKAQVAGSTTALDLATDRPRRRPPTPARATATATIAAPLTGRLSRLALEEGTTLFAVTFAAFQVLVGRRAGRADFVLGAVSANRTQRETEALIGSFMTILPVRARLDDAPAFRLHLRRTAEALIQGFAHQAYPFQRLMTDLRPGGNPGAEPLFDVVFNYRNMPVTLPAMEGLRVSDFRAPHLSTTYDFHLNLTPEAGRLALELDYNPDLFHAATAARWLAGYQAVLEAVAADPEASTATVPVMSTRERRLLEEWSGASVPSPATEFVMDRFETTAAAIPEAPAIEHEGASLSYRELSARMRRLAAHLRQAGVAPGDLVGLFADRSIDTITAMLAILSMGAVYVPLDTRTPRLRIDGMLESAGLRVILTDRTGAPALANRPEPTFCVTDLLAAADPSGVSSEPARVAEQDPAYVIFTSGSTGAPKGVVVPHGSLARYIATVIAAFEPRAGDRQLQFGTLTFDASIREVLVPLGTSGTLVLRSERMLDSPAAFVEQCRALHLANIWMPTTFWMEIARTDWPGGLDLGAEMRVVTFGGEAATPDALRRFQLAIPKSVRLFNGYGPTETTIACTRADLTGGGEELVAVPIGRPVTGATAYVLDDVHQPVPIGVPGELWIGGDNLATGYLNAPEVTAARFVPDSFTGVPGARLYRTGDTVRWLADGQLTFMGRNDFQVKIRGYRVELQEVERALLGVPGVRQAAVIVHEGDRLIGFVTADDPSRLSLSAIRDALALALPQYMVPSQIVALDRLPLSVTNKVDRARLRGLVPAATPEGGAPATRTEAVIARIWEEMLGVTGVGRDDRFLDLGGHSILAMRAANRLRTALGIDLTIGTLLKHPTVAALALELDRRAPPPAADEINS